MLLLNFQEQQENPKFQALFPKSKHSRVRGEEGNPPRTQGRKDEFSGGFWKMLGLRGSSFEISEGCAICLCPVGMVWPWGLEWRLGTRRMRGRMANGRGLPDRGKHAVSLGPGGLTAQRLSPYLQNSSHCASSTGYGDRCSCEQNLFIHSTEIYGDPIRGWVGEGWGKMGVWETRSPYLLRRDAKGFCRARDLWPHSVPTAYTPYSLGLFPL